MTVHLHARQPVGPASPAATPAPSPPPAPMNPAPIIFGIVVALAIGALVLGMRQGKGGLYQRHAAIVGGLLAFSVPIGWSTLAGSSSPNMGYLTFLSAVCSIPGFLLGYFLGKKEAA